MLKERARTAKLVPAAWPMRAFMTGWTRLWRPWSEHRPPVAPLVGPTAGQACRIVANVDDPLYSKNIRRNRSSAYHQGGDAKEALLARVASHAATFPSSIDRLPAEGVKPLPTKGGQTTRASTALVKPAPVRQLSLGQRRCTSSQEHGAHCDKAIPVRPCQQFLHPTCQAGAPEQSLHRLD